MHNIVLSIEGVGKEGKRLFIVEQRCAGVKPKAGARHTKISSLCRIFKGFSSFKLRFVVAPRKHQCQ